MMETRRRFWLPITLAIALGNAGVPAGWPLFVLPPRVKISENEAPGEKDARRRLFEPGVGGGLLDSVMATRSDESRGVDGMFKIGLVEVGAWVWFSSSKVCCAEEL